MRAWWCSCLSMASFIPQSLPNCERLVWGLSLSLFLFVALLQGSRTRFSWWAAVRKFSFRKGWDTEETQNASWHCHLKEGPSHSSYIGHFWRRSLLFVLWRRDSKNISIQISKMTKIWTPRLCLSTWWPRGASRKRMLETSHVSVAYPNEALLIAIGEKIMWVLFSKVMKLYFL